MSRAIEQAIKRRLERGALAHSQTASSGTRFTLGPHRAGAARARRDGGEQPFELASSPSACAGQGVVALMRRRRFAESCVTTLPTCRLAARHPFGRIAPS